MISTFLVEHADAVRVAFWVGLVVALLVGWLLHRQAARAALSALAAVALVGALVLTLYPVGERPVGAFCTVQFSVPFQGIDTLANVAMLMPPTLFLGLRTRRPWATLAAVVGLSALIEVVQGLVPWLGRACDTDDVLMNATGAALGAVGAVIILALDDRRRRTADTGPLSAGVD